MKFSDFYNKKERTAKKQLSVLKKVLTNENMKVEDFTDKEDPYIFVKSDKDLSFDGIRIYKIGDGLAYRAQKENDTHPYGKSYLLPVEELWEDFLGDNIDEEKAGKELAEAITKEIKDFFDKSLKAEQDLKTIEFERKVSVSSSSSNGLFNQVRNN